MPNFSRSPRPITSTREAETPGQVVQQRGGAGLAADVAARDSAARRPPLASVDRLRRGREAVGEGADDDAVGRDARGGGRVQGEFEGHRTGSGEGRVAGIAGQGRRSRGFRTIAGRSCRAADPANEGGILEQRGPMPKLDRYLSREFAQSVFAALVVLGLISLGGVVADLLRRNRARQGPGGPAAVAAGAAAGEFPADPAAAGVDARPAAGDRPAVPRFEMPGACLDGRRPAACCGR